LKSPIRASLLRQTDFAHQFGKRRIRTQRVELEVSGGPKIRLTVRQLADFANLTRDLASTGWGRSKIRPGTNAPFAHLHHDGHLRSDCADVRSASVAATLGVCERGDDTSGTADRCPGPRFFGGRRRRKRRPRPTFQFTFQNVPNQLSFRP